MNYPPPHPLERVAHRKKMKKTEKKGNKTRRQVPPLFFEVGGLQKEGRTKKNSNKKLNQSSKMAEPISNELRNAVFFSIKQKSFRPKR